MQTNNLHQHSQPGLCWPSQLHAHRTIAFHRRSCPGRGPTRLSSSPAAPLPPQLEHTQHGIGVGSIFAHTLQPAAAWLRQSSSSSSNGSWPREQVQRRAAYAPLLSASEISRAGLTNADLHDRQHYEEHIAWDADKEESRVWRRTMFAFQDWKKHRSSYRYVHHLHTLLESRIVRGLLRPVLVIGCCAVAVAAYHTMHSAQLLPACLPGLLVMPIEPFQLTSFALSLLLVFRTNSSYSRWYEGRRRFGRITTTCRDICRQILALVPRTNQACRALMARWLIAFVRASKWYIREDEPLAQELTPWLDAKELQQLVSSPHPPNFCILVLSHAVANCGLSEIAVVKLQEHLSALSQSLSACDRILNTPIPLSYTRHTARFLILWLMLLPLALWGTCGWAMVPTVMVISFVLLGIEEIGVQIEEPFSILALEKLCKKAERHISGMMVMDDGTYLLASTQQQHYIPPPWHKAMNMTTHKAAKSNGASSNHSTDGGDLAALKTLVDVD